MNRFKKWAGREYGKGLRLIAVIFGGIIFWVVFPAVIFAGSAAIDQCLHLPRFGEGRLNAFFALLLIIPGWLLANWTVKVQYSYGQGTPIPLLPTQKLIVKRPYTYCRNPMALGTTAFYCGIAVWLGSLSAL
jgi:protein-S-isoprenylcysteine O-methyltransferase Ste14